MFHLCRCSIFADDSTAYTAGKDTQLTYRKLSLNLDYASDWASSWGMLFSAGKSEHLQIAPKTQNLNQSDVLMHGLYIPRVTTHNHLGVPINSHVSWQDHIDHVYIDCARKIGILRRLQRKLRSTALRKIFIGAIRPRLEYACLFGAGEIPASWSSSKNCSAAGTRFSYLNCNSDLTITNWCCSSRSSRTWPLLI